ncbi:MAG: TonB-dependent receptor [Bacteroidetes bacterium]|nr:TonB-dependent receptor [Bacteroidota bacterium]
MKRIINLTITICLGILSVNAQISGITLVKGSIKDGDKPLESATVSLLNASDSSVVKVELTDKYGNFQIISNKEGSFLVSASSVGYNKKYSKQFLLKFSSTTTIDTISLEHSTTEMKTVVITAKKPLIEQKADKLIVNVDASPTNAGATAMEVLEKSPGISVDNDGNISLKGKAGVTVMMDGKPTYLSAADLANLLKNTPASAIEQIEIMTNPSSKYDAAGNAGIINLKTKKSLKSGLNGSITIGASAGLFYNNGTSYVQPNSQNSINFNYRKNKINIFGNYNPNYNERINNLNINRNFYNEDGTINSRADLHTVFQGNSKNHNAKLGIDYYMNKKNIIGMVFSGFGFFGNPSPVTISNIYNPNGSLQSGLHTISENALIFRNYTGNINYKHSFDSTGREFTIDLDYVKYNNVVDMLLTTEAKDNYGNKTGNPVYLKGHLPSLIDIYSFKSDYIHPLKHNFKIEAGIKTNFVKNNNLVEYAHKDEEGWIPDSRSNHFVYEENINAAYLNFSKKFSEKWNVQAGLRLENTNTRGHQVTNDSSFIRHYTNLFPTAYITYAMNKNNQLMLSYSRRVNRPDYEDLNPFIYFLDSLTYRQGNPYLLPQFTHNIELTHTLLGKYITTISYSKTTDVISEILRQNTEDKSTYLTIENFNTFRNMGVSVNAPFKWAPWFSTNLYVNVYNNHYKGRYNADEMDISYTAFMANITNTFNIAKGFSAELSGFYRSKTIDQLIVMNEMYQMTIGLQKSVFKDKGTVRINFRDPFGWQKFSGSMKYGGVDVTIANRWDTRQAGVSFTYRFGKNTIAPSRRRDNGVSDEINRVGQGK